MRRFILGVLILIASVWIGLSVTHDPGMAVFVYQGYTLEMPLWFALFCLIVAMMLIYSVLHFFDRLDAGFYRWKNWLRWRRKYKSYSKTNRGLLEIIVGNWRRAENFLLDGIAQSDAPLINYLAAAKAAHEQAAYDRRDQYLREAHRIAPEASVVIGLTQAELQFSQGQLEQALATIHQVQHSAPKNRVMLSLLEKLYIRLGDWAGLLNLLPSLRKAKLFTPENIDNLEWHTYEQLINAAANKRDLKILQDLWRTIPGRHQKNPKLIFCYAKHLLLYPDKSSDIEGMILGAVSKSWDTNLVKLYGVLQTANVKKQLIQAEGWIRKYNHQSVLLLTLGRLCVRCQLWGKARHYFEESLRMEPTPETYMEYGKLLEQLGDHQLLVKNYREGLEGVVELKGVTEN